MTMQNGWYCPTCGRVTEHIDFTDSHQCVQYECSQCHSYFKPPRRFSYMKAVRKGGIVSQQRIVVTRMGQHRKWIIKKSMS